MDTLKNILGPLHLGVPMFWNAVLVAVVDTSASPFIFARPKSVILTTTIGFVLIKMFCGFRSQWAMRACNVQNAQNDFFSRNSLKSLSYTCTLSWR